MASSQAAFRPAMRLRAKVDWDVLGATFLINLLGLAIPLAMLQLFDRVIPNQSFATLEAIFLLLCLVVSGDCLLKILRHMITLSNAQHTEARLTRQAIDRVFRGDMAALNALGRESVIDRLISVQKLQATGRSQGLIVAMDLAFSAVFLLAIFLLTGPLIGIPLAMIGLVGLLARRLRNRHRNALAQREENDNRRMSFLIEVLRQVRHLKLLSAEQRMLRRYDTLHHSSADANETLVRIADVSFTMSAMLGQATTGLTSLVGALLVIDKQIGLADLAAAIFLTGRAVQPFINAFFMDAERNYLQQITQKLHDLLSVRDATDGYRALPLGNVAIRLRNLTIRPLGAAPIILSDIDIPKNAITTITGDLGALPGDVLRVLAGEAAAKNGDIFVENPHHADRPALAFVPHETHLLEGTLLDNLTDFAGRKRIPDRMGWARALGLLDDIGLLPGGLDSVFAGQGRSAGSPGFFKKLALATGFGRRAQILILESPFATLDPASADRVVEALCKLSEDTTIILSDPAKAMEKFATLRIGLRADAKATQIYTLHNGKSPQIDNATEALAG